MAKFCTKCGRPLGENETCMCSVFGANTGANPFGQSAPTQNQSANPFAQSAPAQNQNANPFAHNQSQNAGGFGQNPAQNQNMNFGQNPAQNQNMNFGHNPAAQNADVNVNNGPKKTFWETLKDKMGYGEPEPMDKNAYEDGKNIVPDCVDAVDGETAVKQYDVATLKDRVLCIPYAKAKGRVQVTNKRVIFRAPGRSVAGRTTVQHEFAVNELSGIEARKNYIFRTLDFIIGILVVLAGGFVMTGLIGAMCGIANGIALPIILTLMFGSAGCVPFFLLKKKWWLKLLCLGASLVPFYTYGSMLYALGSGYYYSNGVAVFFGAFFLFLAFIVFVLTVGSLFLNAIKPNLVLVFKTKEAGDAVTVRRKKFSLGGERFGYDLVIPAKDIDSCIKEINAVISDLNK